MQSGKQSNLKRKEYMSIIPNSCSRVLTVSKKVGHMEGKGLRFESQWEQFTIL